MMILRGVADEDQSVGKILGGLASVRKEILCFVFIMVLCTDSDALISSRSSCVMLVKCIVLA
jgi:hypothetical protein